MAASTKSARRVLVVEDEYLVSLGITSLLEDLGFDIVGPAARISDASVLATNEDLDLAILDINVAGELSWPVARLLQDRHVPLLFLSGYLTSLVDIPPEFSNITVCLKPLDEIQVKALIQTMLPARQ